MQNKEYCKQTLIKMPSEPDSTESTFAEKLNLDDITSPESKNEVLSVVDLSKKLDDSQLDIEPSLLDLKRKFKKKLTKKKTRLIWMNIFKAIFIRVLFIGQSLFFMVYIICQSNKLVFLALLAPMLIIIIDGFYVCFKRQGFY